VTAISFEVTGASVERYAAVPTVTLTLAVRETSGATVHAAVVRGQVMIEPQKRHYSEEEQSRLEGVFGPTTQWGEALRHFLWANVTTTISRFTGETQIELAIPLTYDFDVAGTPYLESLAGGQIPLVCLFSGTTFVKGEAGFAVEPVAWHEEARFDLPVATYRAAMDVHFPNCGWIRVHRDTMDRLVRFKSSHALPSWDDAMERLLKEAGEET
jgi:hypothetical protein